jgi:hypothetical protein
MPIKRRAHVATTGFIGSSQEVGQYYNCLAGSTGAGGGLLAIRNFRES